MRLNVFISKSGNYSRRRADSIIKGGKVAVNGSVVIEPWFNITDKDKVEISGKEVLTSGAKRYIIFNKPAGVVTTRQDKFAKSKVIDFLPNGLKNV